MGQGPRLPAVAPKVGGPPSGTWLLPGPSVNDTCSLRASTGGRGPGGGPWGLSPAGPLVVTLPALRDFAELGAQSCPLIPAVGAFLIT